MKFVGFSANKKSILVGGHPVHDCGVFYGRALSLHASQREDAPTVTDMLVTELAPTATSMFDDDGYMWSTPKSILKNELAVVRSGRGLACKVYFIDGCAFIWTVPYPQGNATLQTFINAFRKLIRELQKTAEVYLIFDRYA